jgi:hypothetical protein
LSPNCLAQYGEFLFCKTWKYTHVSFWDLFGASIHFGYLYTTFEGCVKNTCYGLTTYLKFCDEFRDLVHVISKLYHASSWGLSWFIVSCLAEDKHLFMAFIGRVNLIGYISQGGVMFPYKSFSLGSFSSPPFYIFIFPKFP